MIVVKGLSESLLCVLCLFYLRYTIFFNVGEKIISHATMFLQQNTCCLSFMVTNIITHMFHNHNQTTQSILGICPTGGCAKRA